MKIFPYESQVSRLMKIVSFWSSAPKDHGPLYLWILDGWGFLRSSKSWSSLTSKNFRSISKGSPLYPLFLVILPRTKFHEKKLRFWSSTFPRYLSRKSKIQICKVMICHEEKYWDLKKQLNHLIMHILNILTL